MTKGFLYVFSITFVTLTILAISIKDGQFNKPPESTPTEKPVISQSGNIQITLPKENTFVGTKFALIGKARVFENTFSFRLKNIRTGKVYAESSTMTDNGEMGQFGDFNFEIDFSGNSPDLKNGDSLLLEVFQFSPKDGAEADKASVILTHQEKEKQVVKLYFTNPKLSKTFDCTNTFFIERAVEKTTGVGQSSLQELINGPTDEERAKGYNSNIDPSTKIARLDIKDGLAVVDLSLDSNKLTTDSCKLETMKSQITQTLKQFPTVKTVNITVNNKKL